MRTTFDKKDNSLRIRLNDRMYSHLVEMSNRQNKSISDYIRDLISKDIQDKSNFQKNFNKKSPSGMEIENDKASSEN